MPSLPGLDPLVMPTRHFRAGLLIVPSLRDWVGYFDKLLAHSVELELFKLTRLHQIMEKAHLDKPD